jgi:hypothetical protein
MHNPATLEEGTNATVLVCTLLSGFAEPSEFAAKTIRANRMASTLPGYTSCPTEADFALYREAHRKLLSDAFAAGVQVYTAIASSE